MRTGFRLPRTAKRRKRHYFQPRSATLGAPLPASWAVLRGVKIAEAARDLGLSRSWASREAHHPETQRLIASLKKQDPDMAASRLRHALKMISDQILNGGGIRAGKGILGQFDKAEWSEFMRARRLLQTYE